MSNELKESVISYQETNTPTIKGYCLEMIRGMIEDYQSRVWKEYFAKIMVEYYEYLFDNKDKLPSSYREMLEDILTEKLQIITLWDINTLADIKLKFGYYICYDATGNVLCSIKEDYFEDVEIAKCYIRTQILQNFENEFQLVETYGLLNSLVVKHGVWVTTNGVPENEYKEMLKKCFVKINELI